MQLVIIAPSFKQPTITEPSTRITQRKLRQREQTTFL